MTEGKVNPADKGNPDGMPFDSSILEEKGKKRASGDDLGFEPANTPETKTHKE